MDGGRRLLVAGWRRRDMRCFRSEEVNGGDDGARTRVGMFHAVLADTKWCVFNAPSTARFNLFQRVQARGYHEVITEVL
jgi:hypothetical protein